MLGRNEAMWDRMVRVVLGLALLSLTIVGPRSLWGLVGLVPLLTGLAGRCPMYTVTGCRTDAGPGPRATSPVGPTPGA